MSLNMFKTVGAFLSAPSALTAAALTDNSGGSANTTLVAISGTYVQAEVRDNFADLAAMVNKLTVDVTALRATVATLVTELNKANGA